MVQITFDYTLSFGKGDSGESYIEIDLTDEEYARLQEAQESGKDFIDCESVADIYDRVYELANEEATNDLVAEGILDKSKKASEVYPIEVYFPYFPEE